MRDICTLSAISIWTAASIRGRFPGEGLDKSSWVPESPLFLLFALKDSWLVHSYWICTPHSPAKKVGARLLFARSFLNHIGYLTRTETSINLKERIHLNGKPQAKSPTHLLCNQMPHCISWNSNVGGSLAVVCYKHIYRPVRRVNKETTLNKPTYGSIRYVNWPSSARSWTKRSSRAAIISTKRVIRTRSSGRTCRPLIFYKKSQNKRPSSSIRRTGLSCGEMILFM